MKSNIEQLIIELATESLNLKIENRRLSTINETQHKRIQDLQEMNKDLLEQLNSQP